ncbi:MAG: AAA family ATPase [Bordetella sp.]|uniref:AAA family ATPase n=1 Tax=Bordetella sp. TaxID=28081 RepID=UPI003F7BFF56
MALLRSFSLPFYSSQPIQLARGRQKNRVSVLLGINGTQKSSILRGLLEDVLFSQSNSEVRSTKNQSLSCDAKWYVVPDRVVAISSAATDRFPSKSGFGGGRIVTKYDTFQYAYVGPRTGRNIVSRSQSIQSLLSEYLQAVSTPASVGKFIDKLSKKTSVPSAIKMRLQGRPRDPGPARPARTLSFDTLMTAAGTNLYSMSRSLRWSKFIEEAQKDRFLMSESKRLFDLLVTQKSSRGVEIEIDLRSSELLGISGIDPRAIHFGLTVGFVGLEGVEFLASGLPPIQPDAFSAGQWGLFSSLTTAALAVRDRTLLLIDEPENALHPAWQREYLTELHRAISHCKGCHVVIATHSPLIVSSLDVKKADLVGLQFADDGSVAAAPLEVPTGWQVTDVLEDIFDLPSTRSPGVVSEIETAMKLITEGVDQNILSLRRVAKRLMPLLNSLPEDDVARQVISSICRVSRVAE